MKKLPEIVYDPRIVHKYESPALKTLHKAHTTATPILRPFNSWPSARYFPAKKSTTAPGSGEIGNDIINVRPKISVSSDWTTVSPGNHQSKELLNHAWYEFNLKLTSLVHNTDL